MRVSMALSASAEALTPPSSVDSMMLVSAKPPVSLPTSRSATFSSRLATPVWSISVPSRIKNGMASSDMFCDAPIRRCTATWFGTGV